mmetsp:Transcript_51812/g.110050  ORF Transcript_51812/g.110050 Transcript_51812/m.110050 type:complete len:778 (+) Transcript_51812:174-2507(+)
MNSIPCTAGKTEEGLFEALRSCEDHPAVKELKGRLSKLPQHDERRQKAIAAFWSVAPQLGLIQEKTTTVDTVELLDDDSDVEFVSATDAAPSFDSTEVHQAVSEAEPTFLTDTNVIRSIEDEEVELEEMRAARLRAIQEWQPSRTAIRDKRKTERRNLRSQELNEKRKQWRSTLFEAFQESKRCTFDIGSAAATRPAMVVTPGGSFGSTPGTPFCPPPLQAMTGAGRSLAAMLGGPGSSSSSASHQDTAAEAMAAAAANLEKVSASLFAPPSETATILRTTPVRRSAVPNDTPNKVLAGTEDANKRRRLDGGGHPLEAQQVLQQPQPQLQLQPSQPQPPQPSQQQSQPWQSSNSWPPQQYNQFPTPAWKRPRTEEVQATTFSWSAPLPSDYRPVSSQASPPSATLTFVDAPMSSSSPEEQQEDAAVPKTDTPMAEEDSDDDAPLVSLPAKKATLPAATPWWKRLVTVLDEATWNESEDEFSEAEESCSQQHSNKQQQQQQQQKQQLEQSLTLPNNKQQCQEQQQEQPRKQLRDQPDREPSLAQQNHDQEPHEGEIKMDVQKEDAQQQRQRQRQGSESEALDPPVDDQHSADENAACLGQAELADEGQNEAGQQTIQTDTSIEETPCAAETAEEAASACEQDTPGIVAASPKAFTVPSLVKSCMDDAAMEAAQHGNTGTPEEGRTQDDVVELSGVVSETLPDDFGLQDASHEEACQTFQADSHHQKDTAPTTAGPPAGHAEVDPHEDAATATATAAAVVSSLGAPFVGLRKCSCGGSR